MAAITALPTQRAQLPTFARGGVLTIAGIVGLALLLTSGRYGYFLDELYFLAAGRQLDWGYADQPPLLPLLAHLMDSIAPGSLVVLRLPATLLTAAGVVVTALIARELGGRRRAQLLSASAFACCLQFLGTGHLLATSTIDPFLWTVLTLLLVRWIRTRADGLLVWSGVVTALALNTKFLIVGFWLVAGCCLLFFGPRTLLRRPALWIGAAIAAIGVLPTVLWQAFNGWPQLTMSSAIDEETSAVGGRLLLLPTGILSAGMLAGAVLLIYGCWQLLRTDALRPYRFLGATLLGLAVLFLVAGGRHYYIAGMFPICWAAAAVTIERRPPARWWRWVPTWPSMVASGLIAVMLTLPVWPESWVRSGSAPNATRFLVAEIDWPRFTESVAEAWQAIPAEQRSRTAIVTELYWQAGALSQYGPQHQLPEPYSGNRGYWTLGSPAEQADTVLYVGTDPTVLRRHFETVRQLRPAASPASVADFGRSAPLWLASGPDRSWAQLWPEFREWALP
ncbi:dolichyl-phosphate-mannose-protein mannosyltransferase [Tamaricihabitans halophyticus]|uniref:Dolichyl-phosphate-mannose-protein mannosyltransferase n=1 Tax=Tamaricihabitans halophyticus TaxID=1262583 RepID=A0A4V2SS18_9PSEU|nr:glycosyltransferase family 39 protein [Tamaricihabitans halophyticus]TCP44796.1 dolichyl-phosphate-mannose-protein mannosyltransferase [Tamaricihabitans halophyticus]